MSVVDDIDESEFDLSTAEVSFFHDPHRRLKTQRIGKTCEQSVLYVVTNSASKQLIDKDGSADVYQGDIPRLFVLKPNNSPDDCKYVDIDSGSLIVKTKYSEYSRRIDKSLDSKWVVDDVCNTIFSIFVADLKVNSKNVNPYYYKSIVYYDHQFRRFCSGGVSLKFFDKGCGYKLSFDRLKLSFNGVLNLSGQTGLVFSQDGIIKNLILDKVFTWKVCN